MRLSRHAVAIIVTTALAAPAPCAAQEPVIAFWQLRALLNPGDTIWITDAQGREIKGRVGSLTPETIALEGDASLVFGAREVHVVRRRNPGRRTWTGAAVGAIAGLGVGIAACAAYPKDDPLRGDACLMAIGLTWMPGFGAGALVGYMFPGKKQVVYRAPASPGGQQALLRVAPIVAPHTKGVAVAFSF